MPLHALAKLLDDSVDFLQCITGEFLLSLFGLGFGFVEVADDHDVFVVHSVGSAGVVKRAGDDHFFIQDHEFVVELTNVAIPFDLMQLDVGFDKRVGSGPVLVGLSAVEHAAYLAVELTMSPYP